MCHEAHARTTLTVPVHGNRALPIGTLMSILKDAQVDVDEYNELA